MEENSVSQCRAGNTKKSPRGRFPKCSLEKVGSLSQWMTRVFIYFIPLQKKTYKEAEGRPGYETMSVYFTYSDSHDPFGHQQFQDNLSYQVSA